MAPFLVAQALAEKGMLDGAITGVSGFFTTITTNITGAVQDRPYLLIVVALVLFLLLKKRR